MNQLDNPKERLEVFVPLRINVYDAEILDRAVQRQNSDRSKLLRNFIRSLAAEDSDRSASAN